MLAPPLPRQEQFTAVFGPQNSFIYNQDVRMSSNFIKIIHNIQTLNRWFIPNLNYINIQHSFKNYLQIILMLY